MALKIFSANQINQNSNKTSKNLNKNDTDSSELKVTKISQQIKNKQRYSVYINGKYTFSLNEYQLAGSGLSSGKILTQDEINIFATESQFGKAYERALNYVTIRIRSEKEIIDYLTRTFLYPKPKTYVNKSGERIFKKVEVDKEKTKTLINRVIERLQLKGYINDEAFAKAWVQSRQLTKRSSLRKLRQELMVKGIQQSIIEKVLTSQEENELQNLEELIMKKRRIIKYQDDVKLTQYLIRQGYSYDNIRSKLSDCNT